MTNSNLSVVVFGQTHPGHVRKENEDNLFYRKPESASLLAARGQLLIVADGMGGHLAGEVASDLAIKVTSQYYYGNLSDTDERVLQDAIQKANYRIKVEADTDSERKGMGTTITAAVLHGDQLCVANVGDSRTYIVQRGAIRQISRDHSLVYDLGLSPSEARRSAYRNQITRALGKDYQVDVDTFREVVQEGDIVLLCSDGLINHVDDDEILRVIQGMKLDQVPGYLIKLACSRGGSDNITVVVAQVGSGNGSRANGGKGGAASERTTLVLKKKKAGHQKWILALIVLLLLLLTAIGAYFLTTRHEKKEQGQSQASGRNVSSNEKNLDQLRNQLKELINDAKELKSSFSKLDQRSLKEKTFQPQLEALQSELRELNNTIGGIIDKEK